MAALRKSRGRLERPERGRVAGISSVTELGPLSQGGRLKLAIPLPTPLEPFGAAVRAANLNRQQPTLLRSFRRQRLHHKTCRSIYLRNHVGIVFFLIPTGSQFSP